MLGRAPMYAEEMHGSNPHTLEKQHHTQMHHFTPKHYPFDPSATLKDDKNFGSNVPTLPSSDHYRTYKEKLPYPPSGQSTFGTSYRGTPTRDTFSQKSITYEDNSVKDVIHNLKCDIDLIKDSIHSKDLAQDTYASLDGHQSVEQRSKSSFSIICQELGFYKLAFIFNNKKSVCIRFLWTLLILCSAAALCYQLYDRVSLYVSSPRHTRVVKKWLDTFEYPSITVCNLNSYRLTDVTDLNLYGLVHTSMNTVNKRSFHRPPKPKSADILYRDFLDKVSQKKESFIQRCHYNGQVCSINNFTDYFSFDYGKCFTFRPDKSHATVRRSGQSSGLSLLLNIEQYQYILGRSSSVGVMVSVHDRNSYPPIRSEGVHTAVGSYTSLSLSKTVKKHDSWSCRSCGQSKTTPEEVSACIAEFQYKYIRQQCNCEISTAKSAQLRHCTVYDYFTCVVRYLDQMRQSSEMKSCTCHEKCLKNVYALSLSEASMSTYAAESWIRSNYYKSDVVEAEYRLARDTYHKQDETIFTNDQTILKMVENGLQNCSATINILSSGVSTYASKYIKARSKMMEILNSLNRSVTDNLDDFKTSSHIKWFHQKKQPVKDKFQTILFTNQVVDKSINEPNYKKVNETLGIVLRNLDALVIPKSSGGTNTQNFIPEISVMAKRFREDILMGYGQNYREFKNQHIRDSLQTIVKNILDLCEDITTNLIELYNLIKKTVQNLGLNLSSAEKDKLKNTLDSFYRRIGDIKNSQLEDLFQNLEILLQRYETQKLGVISLSETLLSIGRDIEKKSTPTENVSKNILDLVKNLQTKISTLRYSVSEAATAYMAASGSKTTLAEALSADNMTVVMSSSQLIIKNLRTTLNSNRQEGSELASLIQPIKDRFLEFGLVTEADLNLQLQSLKSPDTGRVAEDIVSLVDDKFKSIADYQSEMKDYLKGAKLNGKFYQNNFMQLDFYFPEMSETEIHFESSYTIFSLACDIGATLSLYLGASLLTILGFIDLLIQAKNSA